MEPVLVSACLLGEAVRFDGGDMRSDHAILQRWLKEGRVVSVCPEVAGGLPVLTYCDGIGCNASTKGALNMARLGFKVRELIGGLDWWKHDGHPTEGRSASTRASGTCGCS